MTCSRGYECTQCGEHFRSLTDFDAHQTVKGGNLDYTVVCDSPEVIAEGGLTKDTHGLWTSGTGEVRKGPPRTSGRSQEARSA